MKKVIVALVGSTVLLVGIALLVLPGPGLPIVVAGIAILATEFLWARRALRNAKGAVARARRRSGIRAWLRARKHRK
jgi:tellurite resistance protein TerC